MYDAMKLLSQCEWIDNKNVGIFVIDDIISISFSDIDCSGMVEPKPKNISIMRIISRKQAGWLIIY